MPGVPSLDNAIALVRAGALSDGLEQLLALHSTHGPDSSEPLPDVQLATLLAVLVDCRLARGDLANAMTLGEELTPLLSGTGLAAALAHQAKGEVSAALGDAEAAVAHFVKAGQLAPDASIDVLPWRAGAALAHLRNGNARAAGDLAREHVEALARRGARRMPWRGRCAPWPPSTPGPTGSSTCCAPGPSWRGQRGAAVGPDRHRPGRAAAAHPRSRCRGAGARAAPLGRGPRGPAGAVAPAEPGTPPARPARRAPRKVQTEAMAALTAPNGGSLGWPPTDSPTGRSPRSSW